MKASLLKVLGIGCGVAVLLGLAGVTAVVLLLAHVVQDPRGVEVSVTGPLDVAVGQTFDLTVTVTNRRPGKAVSLSDIDVAEEYLAGFTIAGVTPKPKSNTHVPFDNSRSFSFDVRIPPSQARRFTFTLRAEKQGVYRGDVDVCEGARFITEMAQTSVKANEQGTR